MLFVEQNLVIYSIKSLRIIEIWAALCMVRHRNSTLNFKSVTLTRQNVIKLQSEEIVPNTNANIRELNESRVNATLSG